MKSRKSRFIINSIFAVVIQIILTDTHSPQRISIPISAQSGSESLYLRDRKCVCDFSKVRINHFGIISPSYAVGVLCSDVYLRWHFLQREPYPSVDPEDRNVFT